MRLFGEVLRLAANNGSTSPMGIKRWANLIENKDIDGSGKRVGWRDKNERKAEMDELTHVCRIMGRI